jgi:predicted ATP-grasp superfamily ATP-dependent carboligase
MKAKYNSKTVYIKYKSGCGEYVLVSRDKNKLIGLFKVNLSDLTDINIKDLK